MDFAEMFEAPHHEERSSELANFARAVWRWSPADFVAPRSRHQQVLLAPTQGSAELEGQLWNLREDVEPSTALKALGGHRPTVVIAFRVQLGLRIFDSHRAGDTPARSARALRRLAQAPKL